MNGKPTSNRTFYLEDKDLWITARRIAQIRGESVSGLFEQLLRKYVETNRGLLSKVEARKKAVK